MTKTYVGLCAESPQGSGKDRISLVILLQDSTSPSAQGLHHLDSLMKSHKHRETLTVEPGSIRCKSVLYQVYLGLQNRVVALKNVDLDPHGPYRGTCNYERCLTLV